MKNLILLFVVVISSEVAFSAIGPPKDLPNFTFECSDSNGKILNITHLQGNVAEINDDVYTNFTSPFSKVQSFLVKKYFYALDINKTLQLIEHVKTGRGSNCGRGSCDHKLVYSKNAILTVDSNETFYTCN